MLEGFFARGFAVEEAPKRRRGENPAHDENKPLVARKFRREARQSKIAILVSPSCGRQLQSGGISRPSGFRGGPQSIHTFRKNLYSLPYGFCVSCPLAPFAFGAQCAGRADLGPPAEAGQEVSGTA